jgi:DNA-binding MarR family transcriptional regulator
VSADPKDHDTRDDATALSRETWTLMSDLVLDHQRRRQVSDAVGLSFARTRAVRRIAKQPMSMGELATVLGIDRPNATVLVDELETQGLVRRQPHPTDRRAKIVEATPKGKTIAKRANDILSTPPPALSALGAQDLKALRRLLRRITPQE